MKMKRQRNVYVLLGLVISFVFLTAFQEKRRPHLIVGLWKITDQNAVTLTNRNLYIEQLYFSGDELSSSFSYTNKNGKEDKKGLRLAYQTYENIDGFAKPVVYFISTCDKDFKLAFTIEKLTKDSLELKCIRDVISDKVLLNRDVLSFERIAGPPENMSSSEDAIQMEIRIDEGK
jgi:hypothetical protein